ncbi:MAG: SDR family oxidoreductase [Acidimicrobiia bacterium]|nr:SDR family oxidoreductase [Acidimicrobiia bacterium]
MERYVVTGGAGFIGSALVRALLNQGGSQVAVIDNFLSGKRSNLEGLDGALEVHDADIRDFDAMSRMVKGAAAVFHLAAIPSVPRSIAQPVPSHEVNIDGTFTLLRACAEAKAGRVVYAASSSAYGDTEVLPKVESMMPRPKSPYAAQKLMGEYYAGVFADCFGLPGVSLRFFNVYGPRQDPLSPYSGVISIFMRCLIERRSPTIHGDGEQSRDFTFVEDVAALCIKASQAPGVSGKVINAGNGNRYTLNQVWQTLNKIEGVSIAAEYGQPRPGDVRDSQADTTLARTLLGHQPEFRLEEGLRRTLAWYRETST